MDTSTLLRPYEKNIALWRKLRATFDKFDSLKSELQSHPEYLQRDDPRYPFFLQILEEWMQTSLDILKEVVSLKEQFQPELEKSERRDADKDAATQEHKAFTDHKTAVAGKVNATGDKIEQLEAKIRELMRERAEREIALAKEKAFHRALIRLMLAGQYPDQSEMR